MKKGFTLIELVVVIALISLLAVSLSIKITNIIYKSHASQVQSDLSTLRTGIEMFIIEGQEFPNIKPGTNDLSSVISSKNNVCFGNFFPDNKIPVTPAWSGEYHPDAPGKKSGNYIIYEKNDVIDSPGVNENGTLRPTNGRGGWFYYYNHKINDVKTDQYKGDFYPNLTKGAYGTDIDWRDL